MISGSLYGLAGAGLVLTYKTSGIFNFAHGAIATASAYIFYAMYYEAGLPWIPSFIVSVFVVGILVGLFFSRIAHRISAMPTALQILGTVGVVLLVQALATIKYGPNTITVDQFLPGSNSSFHLFGAVVTGADVIIFCIAVVCVTALALFFRYMRTGVAMRAVVDDPDLLSMQATNPQRVRRMAWLIGSVFAALTGVLIMPLIGLDSILLTLLVVQAFGAAAVGAFSNIALTFVGGLVIGIGSSVSTKYVIDVPWLSGLPASIPFVLLLVVLLALPRHRLVRIGTFKRGVEQHYRAPIRVRLGVSVVVLAVLACIPTFAGDNMLFYTTALVTAIIILSLGLLVRVSGQVSLCHAAFAAVGAVSFSQFAVDHGLPWLLSLLLAGLVLVPVGALVAIPAIRLSGLYLALATLGFGILLQMLLYSQSWMFTTETQGRVMPLPSFATTPKAFYYVVLVAVILAAIAVIVTRQSRLGRMLQGLADSPTGMTAMGLNINVSKVMVFCISAFIAGIAGALWGVSFGYAQGGDTFYGSFNSLVLIATIGIAPFAEPWFAVVAAVGVVIPAYVQSSNTPYWLNVLFGVSAIAVAFNGGTGELPERVRAFVDRARGKPKSRPIMSADELNQLVRVREDVPRDVAGLEVRSLRIRFGGLTAVDGLSLKAPRGRITGLIGPNGAGKTSTFNACSGLSRNYQGRILFDGEDISRVSPSHRAQRGLGRTFQIAELCESLTVLENVSIGREAAQAGGRFYTQLASPRTQRRDNEAAAWQALEMCGITDLADREAYRLSTGQRRLVEMARSLAGSFSLILLDEPSAGLDRAETARLGELLRNVVDQRGVGLLLVEHDMSLTMGVCDYIYVMDFGRLIFEGTPQEVANDPIVRAAYLGTADVGEPGGDDRGDALSGSVQERGLER